MKNKFRVFTILAFLLIMSAVSIANAAGRPAEVASSGKLVPLNIPAGGKIIPHQYIVVFKAGAQPNALNSLTNIVETSGGKVNFSYTAALHGFSAYIPSQAALEALQKDSNVEYIEADQEMSVSLSWGLDRLDERNLYLNNIYNPGAGVTGAGVRVYVIDTGIRTTHNDFGGRAYAGFTAVGTSAEDCNGHGTHVAGTIGGSTHGVAKNVTLYAVRVLDCNGSGSVSNVIAGVNWVTANRIRPAVANISLTSARSSALNSAVTNSINAGVVYTVAAGNTNTDACQHSPGSVPNAITVGSTTNTDTRSSFSNFGKCLKIFAPGSNIPSAWHTSNTATNTISGTSMASAHVAGAAALHLQFNPSANPNDVYNALLTKATPNIVKNPGASSVNRLLYVKR